MSYKNFSFVFLGIALGAFTMGALQVTFAWTAPTGAPPTSNVAAPINVSATAQSKAGSIGATTFSDYNNSGYYIDPNSTSIVNALNTYGAITSSVRNYSVTDDWALTTYGAGWAPNAQKQNSRASIYTNDVYIRSSGKWVSQIDDAVSTSAVLPGTQCGAWSTYGSLYPNFPCNGHTPNVSCPAGYYRAYTAGSNSDNWVMSCIKA